MVHVDAGVDDRDVDANGAAAVPACGGALLTVNAVDAGRRGLGRGVHRPVRADGDDAGQGSDARGRVLGHARRVASQGVSVDVRGFGVDGSGVPAGDFAGSGVSVEDDDPAAIPLRFGVSSASRDGGGGQACGCDCEPAG